MHDLRTGLLIIGLAAVTVSAVDGISVSTHWSGSNQNLYGGYGRIDRHTIRNSTVVSTRTLYTGEARYPTIDQSGTRVAFIKKSGKVSLVDIDGGTVTDLVDIPGTEGYLDWPAGQWLWYSRGGYNQSGSAEVWKVNVDTRQTQRIITFKKSGGSTVRQWNWMVSADGTRMFIRCNDSDGNFNGTKFGDIFWIKVPTTIPKDIILGNGSSSDRSGNFDGCGVAMNPSGTKGCYFGSVGHGGLNFANWWQTNSVIDLSASTLNSWGENMGNSYNRTRWSVNSEDWVCVMSGWCCRGDGGSNQVLYDYVNHEQVAVTHNAANSNQNDDAGDFWLGDPGGTTDDPSMFLTPKTLAFSGDAGGAAPAPGTVTVTNDGGGTLNAVSTSVVYASGSGWLQVTRTGTGNTQTLTNSVNLTTLAAGAYSATVTVACANADPTSTTYTVSLEVLQPQTLRDPDNPGNATTNGLRYDYYEGSWTALPDFDTLIPADSGVADGVSPAPALRETDYGLRFTGYVSVPQDGNYTFYTNSDDGSALHIGTSLVVDNDGNHGMLERSGSIGLKAGKHAIVVAFYQGGGGAGLSAAYACAAAGIAKTELPANALFCRAPVAQSAIQVTGPDGGETFHVGDVMTISWIADAAQVSDAVIEISPDDGESWYVINDSGAVYPTSSNWGAYEWTIPEVLSSSSGTGSLVSSHCLVKVQTYSRTLGDVSDSWFTVLPGSTVRSAGPHNATPPTTPSLAALPGEGLLVTALAAPGSVVTLVDTRGRVVRRGIIGPDHTCAFYDLRRVPGLLLARVQGATIREMVGAPAARPPGP